MAAAGAWPCPGACLAAGPGGRAPLQRARRSHQRRRPANPTPGWATAAAGVPALTRGTGAAGRMTWRRWSAPCTARTARTARAAAPPPSCLWQRRSAAAARHRPASQHSVIYLQPKLKTLLTKQGAGPTAVFHAAQSSSRMPPSHCHGAITECNTGAALRIHLKGAGDASGATGSR